MNISFKMLRFYSVNVSNILFLCLVGHISAKSCKFNVKVNQLLLNEGFHRNITYGVVFHGETEEQKRFYKDCIIGIAQALPPGVYANPDELGDLRRNTKLTAIPINRINIELPAEESQPSSVYIMARVRQNKVSVWLPVHARYHHALPMGGTARNEIGPPKLNLRCPDKRLDVCGIEYSPSATFLCNGISKEKCSWKEIPYTMVTDTLVWEVPVGRLEHGCAVAGGTALVLVAGSLYLLRTLHRCAGTPRRAGAAR